MIKKIGISFILLASLQASLFADTRVERFHNSKQHHTSTHSTPSHTKRYIRPYAISPTPYRARPHRGHVGQRHYTNRHRNDYRFRHDGLDYRYRAGTFYRPHNNGYRVVNAPLGAIIMTLPNNCERVYHHDREYYRYDNVYYQEERGRRGYRIVRNPYNVQTRHYRAGEMLRSLPYGASAVIIDNIEYFEYQNSYFLPQRRAGVRMYMVVNF